MRDSTLGRGYVWCVAPVRRALHAVPVCLIYKLSLWREAACVQHLSETLLKEVTWLTMRNCTLARGCMCAAPVTRELLNEGIWLIMRYCNLARGQVSSTGQKVFEEAPGCSLKIALWWEAICSSCQKSFARDQNWWTWKIALVAFAKQGFLGRGPGEPEILHSSIKPYPCSSYRNALLKIQPG